LHSITNGARREVSSHGSTGESGAGSRGAAGGSLVRRLCEPLAATCRLRDVPLDEQAAGFVTAQLLHLEAEDATRDVYLYINSSGGSTATLLGVYDTMQCLRPDVATVCLGQAATAGAVVLAAGAPKKRYALAHSRIWIHQPQSEFFGGLGDLEIRAREVLRERRLVAEVLARHTTQPVDTVARDADRDFIMSAEEARDYGIIDHVIEADHLPHVSDERD
jgi:ATP-dependent Clp protease, protease subunit